MFAKSDVEFYKCGGTYILLCKLNYGYHSQTHFHYFFQTGHFSAVKFVMGYEKNMSFLVIPKSPKVLKKSDRTLLSEVCLNNHYCLNEKRVKSSFSKKGELV